jgi:predicted phosphodiesterase
MLDIQIVSDLHLEFWSKKGKFNFIKPSAPILALVGDICCCGADDDFEIFKRFIYEILTSYEHIILVAGNHEYYYNPSKKKVNITAANTIEGINAKIKQFFKETSPKLHFLNNSGMQVTIGKTTYLIVGTTLWSWIPEDRRAAVQETMNDYQFIYTITNKKIKPLTSLEVATRHIKCYKYLKTQVLKAKKAGSKIIILTHHKPYLSPTHNPKTLDVAYESDLTSLMVAPVVLWAYGHTHIADDSWHKTVHLYSNPKGYPSQKTKYNRAAVVKV